MEASSRFPPCSPHGTVAFALEAAANIGSVSLEKESSGEEHIEDSRYGVAWLWVCAFGGW